MASASSSMLSERTNERQGESKRNPVQDCSAPVLQARFNGAKFPHRTCPPLGVSVLRTPESKSESLELDGIQTTPPILHKNLREVAGIRTVASDDTMHFLVHVQYRAVTKPHYYPPLSTI